MKINPNLEKILLSILVFLIPSQLAIHFWPSWAFVFGIRIDYLSPAIYLTDILVVALLVNWIVYQHTVVVGLFKKYVKYIAFFLVLIGVNLFYSTSFLPSLFKWLKVIEMIFFATYLSIQLKNIGKNIIFKSLFASLIFFSTIGIVQFLISKTIGGPFYLLGERTFTISTPGIALANIFGQNFLRVYSTFPHPNVLAGFFGAALVFLFETKFVKHLFSKNKKVAVVGLLIVCLGLLLSFSLSAFIGLGVVFLLYLLKLSGRVKNIVLNIIFGAVILGSLLLPIVADKLLLIGNFQKNISERLDLSIIAGHMINEKFWLGEGFNTFIINMPKIKPTLTSSWLLQPVHNIFLLTLSEVGVFGLLLLILFFHKSLKVYPLVFVFIMLTGFFDHYWLDDQQSLLLLSLLSGFVFRTKK